MKTIIALMLALSGFVSGDSEAILTTRWQWMAPFQVEQPGMVRLEIPPSVLDASRPDLGDLRILPRDQETPYSKETPYLMDLPVHRGDTVQVATGFKVSLSDRTTLIEVSADITAPIEAVDLTSPAKEFLKSVSIEAITTGGEWRPLISNTVIFRQPDGAERVRIPLPAGKWEGLRIKVDDDRSQPVPFTGVRLITASEKPVTFVGPISISTREDLSNETRLTLDLGARNLDVAELHFEITDAVFSRACTLGFDTSTPDGETRMERIPGGTLYRVQNDHAALTESLVIPVHRRIQSRYLIVTIHNGDSPALAVTRIKAGYYPTILAFHAAEAGDWKLITGNPKEKQPQYDLSQLRGMMGEATGKPITPSALRKDPGFEPLPILPRATALGIAIDLTEWARSRVVHSPSSGVIGIELDARVLAGCRSDLGDLRLVQNGRQIPYLIRSGTVMRDLKPSVISVKDDPKRPAVSRWEITLPIENLPIVELTARSSARLFTRRFVVAVERKDPLGNVSTEIAGTADWTRSGEDEAPLAVNLRGQRMPGVFSLETDHGDNPPIPVNDVAVRFAAPSITAELADGAPLFLCYGNPKASPPQYDLGLARKELLAADQQATVLSDEEILQPHTEELQSTDAGSPWLWLALGGVVVALLVVVAKLLPKPAAE